jgi:hypothetical protein
MPNITETKTNYRNIVNTYLKALIKMNSFRYGPGMPLPKFNMLYTPPGKEGFERHYFYGNRRSTGSWRYIKAKKPYGPLKNNEKYKWNKNSESWIVEHYENRPATKLYNEIKQGIKKFGTFNSWIEDKVKDMERVNHLRATLGWFERPPRQRLGVE